MVNSMNDHWKNLTHQSLVITGSSVSYLEETESVQGDLPHSGEYSLH